jgi:hypothetical protein
VRKRSSLSQLIATFLASTDGAAALHSQVTLFIMVHSIRRTTRRMRKQPSLLDGHTGKGVPLRVVRWLDFVCVDARWSGGIELEGAERCVWSEGIGSRVGCAEQT